MIRNLTIAATLATSLAMGVSHGALAQSSSGSTMEIGSDVILATSVIGMPTFIKGEEGTVGPIGSLADAIVSLDGMIQGVVIRTPQGRAFAVPADRLEQGRVQDRPVLLINISREDAEQAPDVSSQMPQQSGDGSAQADGSTQGSQSTGTGTSDQSGSSGSSTDSSSGSDSSGTSSSDSSSSDTSGSSDSSGGTSSDSQSSDGTGATTGDQTGVTGTTIDGTNAAGADEGSDGTGTESRAGTDGQPMENSDGSGNSDGSSSSDGSDSSQTNTQ